MFAMYKARTGDSGNTENFRCNSLPVLLELATPRRMPISAENEGSRKKNGSRMVALSSETPRIAENNGDSVLQRSITIT